MPSHSRALSVPAPSAPPQLLQRPEPIWQDTGYTDELQKTHLIRLRNQAGLFGAEAH